MYIISNLYMPLQGVHYVPHLAGEETGSEKARRVLTVTAQVHRASEWKKICQKSWFSLLGHCASQAEQA